MSGAESFEREGKEERERGRIYRDGEMALHLGSRVSSGRGSRRGGGPRTNL